MQRKEDQANVQVEETPEKKTKLLIDSSTAHNEAYNEVQDLDDTDIPFVFVNDSATCVADNLETPITPNESDSLNGVLILTPTSTVTYKTDSTSTSSTSTSSYYPQKYLINDITSLDKFDLKDFLNQDLVGQALLGKSGQHEFCNADRDRLCDMIISYFINKYHKLQSVHFRILARKIAELFPKEKPTTYFVSPVPKRLSRKRKSEAARGKLVDKYRNKLHLINVILGDSNNKKNSEEPKDNIDTNEATNEGKLPFHSFIS